VERRINLEIEESIKMAEKGIATGKTVKALQAGIQKEVRDFEASSREFNNSVKELHKATEMKTNEWQGYVSKEFNPAIKKMHEAVQKLVSEWKEYMSKDFKPAIRRMHGAMRRLGRDIEKKSSEFQEYSKVEFWG